MKKLNVGVIGTGWMGSNHARIYGQMDNAVLVAVCDANAEVSEKIGQKYHARHYTDYKEMLK